MAPLIEIQGLKMYFPIKAGPFAKPSYVHAVDDVSFTIEEGETFGLVGESGSGKTTTGRCILRILDPTDGVIRFDGTDITRLEEKALRSIRPKMQMVFQDPFLSLNPRKTIGQILSDPFKLHTDLPEDEIMARVEDLLVKVGLAEEFAYRYPYELSGGQKQRVAIARAIALRPKFVFLDEPTSALDVSVQAQILNLLIDLQAEFKMSYLFVTHNIHLIRFMADRVAVMYLGKIVEVGSVHQVFEDPRHPYTQALLSAVPEPDPEVRKERIILKGDVPTPIDPPPGCRFYQRCWLAEKGLCDAKDPEFLEVDRGHLVACYFADKTQLKQAPTPT
jgi:oligopeptide/dipeptide ABC transporter ATP-binding protein